MANVFSDNAQKILTFLQENPNVDLTAKEIAAAIDLSPRTVNGCVTSLANKKLAYRTPKFPTEEGANIKIIRLTEEGKQADPHAQKPDQN